MLSMIGFCQFVHCVRQRRHHHVELFSWVRYLSHPMTKHIFANNFYSVQHAHYSLAMIWNRTINKAIVRFSLFSLFYARHHWITTILLPFSFHSNSICIFAVVNSALLCVVLYLLGSIRTGSKCTIRFGSRFSSQFSFFLIQYCVQYIRFATLTWCIEPTSSHFSFHRCEQ